MKHWIPTYSGKMIALDDPNPDSIDPLDIAVALSRKPRWNGHTTIAYTVAEHSLLASYHVPPPFQFDALMHDASEAYLGDVSRPLKLLLGDVWKLIEERFEHAIARRFVRLHYPWPAEVLAIDDTLLGCERRDLVHPLAARHSSWPWPYAADGAITIDAQKPYPTLLAWIDRFEELTAERVDRRLLPPRRSHWRATRRTALPFRFSFPTGQVGIPVPAWRPHQDGMHETNTTFPPAPDEKDGVQP